MTTWDVANVGPGISFGAGNLSVSAPGISRATSVRSTTSQSSGKFYFEVTGNTVNRDWSAGICNSAYPLVDELAGNDLNSLGTYPVQGDQPPQSVYWQNNQLTAGGVSSSNGEVNNYAIDFTNKLIWWSNPTMRAQVGANAWNNNASANPSTGAGGISFNGMPGPYYIVWNAVSGSTQATLNVGATAYDRPLPSGFSSWDTQSTGATSTTTWDPARLGPATLSNNNLTANPTTSGTAAVVFSTVSRSSGKYVVEITMGTASTNWDVGIANSANSNTWDYLGFTPNAIGFYPVHAPNAQAVYVNSSWLSEDSPATSGSGDKALIAVDFAAKLVWFSSGAMRARGNTWNNSTSANPATGSGGFSFSSVTGPYFIAACSDQPGSTMTLNTIGPFSLALPSGFQNFDTSSSTIATLDGVSATPGVTGPSVSIPNTGTGGTPTAGTSPFSGDFSSDFGDGTSTPSTSPFSGDFSSDFGNGTSPITGLTATLFGVAATPGVSEPTVTGAIVLGGESVLTGVAANPGATEPTVIIAPAAPSFAVLQDDALFFAAEIEAYRPGATTFNFAYGIGAAPIGAIELLASRQEDSAVIRSSDLGYRTLQTDQDGLRVFPPTLTSAFQIDRKINVSPVSDGGGVSFSYGEIQISNANNAYDDISRAWNSDGRSARIYYGIKRRDSYRDYVTDPSANNLRLVFAGTAQPWTLDQDTLRIPLRDATYQIERRLQKRQYSGLGGYDGPPELAGTDMPMVRGGVPSIAGAPAYPVLNVSPVLIAGPNLSTQNLYIYQYTDGPGAITALYDGGLANWSYVGDIGSGDLFSDISPPGPAQYKTDNKRGLFRLGGTPVGQVTVDCIGYFPISGLKSNLFDIVRYLLVEELNSPVEQLDLGSFESLTTTYPYWAGIYFDPTEGVDGITAIDRLLSSVGAKLVPLRDGRLRVMVIRSTPLGILPKGNLDTTNIIDVQPFRLPQPLDPPPFRFRVGYQHVNTVQSSGFLGGVSEDRKSLVSKADRYATWISYTVQAAFKRPQDPPPINGALLRQGDAQAVANDLGEMWGKAQRGFEVSCPAEAALNLEIGDFVNITYPISDLATGRVGQIVAERLTSEDAVVTYTIVGVQSTIVPIPGRVTNLAQVRATETTLDVRWDAVQGQNVRYQVLYKQV